MPRITLAGEDLIAQKQVAQQPLNITRFIFANVPGLNPNSEVDRAAPKPPAGQIVYDAEIPPSNKGYVNPAQVVYSLQVGSDVGDWDFNWIGLESAEGVLFAVAYVPLQQKRRNIPPLQIGNNITRNFLVVFDGAQALTGITIDASTWQHDFTVRLAGIDERERQSNRDIFGRACFFGSALQLEKVGETYQLKPGTAYVEGVRLQAMAALAVVPPALPTTAWLDVALQRELNGVVATWSIVWGAGKVDYVDGAGVQHYCVAIADLPNSNTITDSRPVENIAGPLVAHFAARVGDYAGLRARATTKDDVGLGNLPNAKSDDPGSNSSEILATTKAVQLHIDACLEDTPDKPRARDALGLKSGALAEVTEHSSDSTAGRLQKTGDFGWGSIVAVMVPGLDMDAKNIPGGHYRYDGSVSGNRPGSGIGTVIIGRINDTAHTQIAVDDIDASLFFRSYESGTPDLGDWTELSRASQLPIGVPLPWASATPPDGYLAMAGQSFSPASYPRLAVLYTSNQLPDLRGEVIRGWDNARGIDVGRALLSSQLDAFQGHAFAVGGYRLGEDGLNVGGGTSRVASFIGADTPSVIVSDGVNATPRISSETRSRNVAFNYICRAK